MKILLVEDEPLILMDVELRLQQAGHSVEAVSNADKAVGLLQSRSFDLIITDIDMPGSMDGLMLAAAVRNRWAPVKIVVMSGKRRPTEADLPVHARFISKPLSQIELLEVVGNW